MNTGRSSFSTASSADGGGVVLPVSTKIYSLEAIQGACWLFLERAFVYLEDGEDEIRVHLAPQDQSDERELVGAFCNELLNQSLRLSIAGKTSAIRESYIARAFYSAPERTDIDALLAELDAEELDEDPLGIAVPWQKEVKDD